MEPQIKKAKVSQGETFEMIKHVIESKAILQSTRFLDQEVFRLEFGSIEGPDVELSPTKVA